VRLGVFTPLYYDRSLEEALDLLAGLGVEAVEIGTGNWPGDKHCDVDALLGDPAKTRAYREAIESRGMVISALSQHGNPVHPDTDRAAHDHGVWEKTLRLAEALEVGVVNAFSGCPGDGPDATGPNWVTCTWPDEFAEILEWQWSERVIPYWQDQLEPLRAHGVKAAIELHPGFCVYNPASMLRLRTATGPEIGANFDPSHLFWQGIDPVAAIKALGPAIHHVHAKDTFIDAQNVAVDGVLDTKGYRRLRERSWYFRTIGFGQGERAWRDIISALRLVGYDWVVSIEHEDRLLSNDEGLVKAVQLLLSLRPADAAGPQHPEEIA
jgi:sugar phosphate isomerase/epimerase